MRRLILIPAVFMIGCAKAAPVPSPQTPVPRPVASNPSGDCSPGELASNVANNGNLFACGDDRQWHAQTGVTGLADPGSNGIVNRTSPNSTTAFPINGANGIPQLDSGGKLITSVLPSSLVLTTAGAVFGANTYDFSGASHMVVIGGSGASKPANCSAREIWFATDATAGQNLFGCTSSNTWTQLGGTGSGLQPTGGVSYVPFVTSGTTTQAATSSNLISILGFTPQVALTFSGPLSNTSNTVTINQVTNVNDGYLSHIDWNTFNNKAQSMASPCGANTFLTNLTSGSVTCNPVDYSGISNTPAVQGNGPKLLSTTTGAVPNGHCFAADVSGNAVDSGGACSGSPTPPGINYTPTGTSPNTITQQTANMKVIYGCTDWGSCNGSADDTTSWNNAITQAHANSVEIYVPIGKTMRIHQPSWQDNLSIVCGQNAILKESQATPTGPMLSPTFHTNIQIHNCTVDIGATATRTGSNNAAIYLQSDPGFLLDNVHITNSGVPSPSTEGILVFNVNGGTIQNSSVDHTILATHYDINNGSTNQQSLPATTLFGSNNLDNLLLVQAATAGTGGNSMTATIVNSGANQSLSFSGTSTALTIHLATDASGNSTSTAGSIIQAFQGDPEQQWFRIITYDTATGIVQSAAVQTLSGGVSANEKILLVNNTSDGSQSQGIHVQDSGAPAGTYCNVELAGNKITNVYDWQDYLATSSLHSGQNGNGIDIDGCSGVHVHDNQIIHSDFSGVRIFNGWYNDIGPNNLIRFAGEQSLYAEFNSQGNIFHDNKLYDGLFGVNDNNAEQRTNKQLNEYIHNSFRNIAGTGIICNACIAKDNTFDGVIIGAQISGGGTGGYNSQLVNNTCVVDPSLPPTLNCIGIGSGYGGTSTLIEGNRTVGTPTFGHIWGIGNPSGHITNVTLGNPTTVTFSTGTPATGNQVCFFGVALFSTYQLNGNCYTATVSGSTFTVPVDSTLFAPWVATTSVANPGSANGWRFPGFWYDGNPATSPAAFNSNMLVRNENFNDAVKGTPQNGSSGFIVDDNCSSGTLSSLGTGTGTNAKYTTAAGWTCW